MVAELTKDFRLLEWEIHPQEGTFTGAGKVVHVEPKVMDVLIHLAKRGDKLTSREQLIEAVWENRYVSEEVLTRCVSELRGHLGDDARAPRFIKTVPKRGYRLLPTVEPLVNSVQEPHTVESRPTPFPASNFSWIDQGVKVDFRCCRAFVAIGRYQGVGTFVSSSRATGYRTDASYQSLVIDRANPIDRRPTLR